MKYYDRSAIDEMEKSYRTNFINSLWGFKSVSLVGTSSPEGVSNLAIFSQVFHLGANPALVGLIIRPAETERHTYENLKTNMVFTLNHIHASFVMQAHQTSARYPKLVSEFEAVGLTEIYHSPFPAPYVDESHLQIGCRYDGEYLITQNNTIMIIGRVEEVRIKEGAVHEDGFIDLEALGTITSSNLDSYHVMRKVCRLTYAKPYRLPNEL